jgi:hypothetical protein
MRGARRFRIDASQTPFQGAVANEIITARQLGFSK